MKRRLEQSHKAKSDDMDIGQVDDYIKEPMWDMGGNHMGSDYNSWGAWDADAIGKGKAKGKGKFGGWAPPGKGQYMGSQKATPKADTLKEAAATTARATAATTGTTRAATTARATAATTRGRARG